MVLSTVLQPAPPRLLTRAQAAAYLNIAVRTLTKLTPDVGPEIGYIRLTPNGDKRFPRELLDAYVDSKIEEQVGRHLLPPNTLAS